MKIGELASKAGVTVEAIRFYEREGVLPKPNRTAANYRTYGSQHLEDLAFVVFCRGIDIPLEEIKGLLHLKHLPMESCESISHAIEQRLLDVEKRIVQLTALQAELIRLKNKCDGHSTVGSCGILKSMAS